MFLESSQVVVVARQNEIIDRSTQRKELSDMESTLQNGTNERRFVGNRRLNGS